MTARRFLNLVMRDLRKSGSYWLSRMKPEENLFFPSTVEAVAQQAQNKQLSYTPLVESTLQLPKPKFRFRSSRAHDSTLAFLPFYGLAGAGGPSEGRVVVADSAGHTLLYDAHDASAEILPPINEPAKWPSPISLCVTNPKNTILPDALYTINQTTSSDFKSLVYCNGDAMAWRWLTLPGPPYLYDKDVEDRTIESHTLLRDGKTICFSGGFGTYTFDTDSKEWTKLAASWRLPFVGGATRVPELYNLYFGFHESDPEIIVALELPSPVDDGDALPNVLHQWRGFCPPHQNEWSLIKRSLMYLGNYRFCIAKWFLISDRSPYEEDNLLDIAAVLTGVEIVNGEANKDKLLMVKHKTRTFIFDDRNLESVI